VRHRRVTFPAPDLPHRNFLKTPYSIYKNHYRLYQLTRNTQLSTLAFFTGIVIMDSGSHSHFIYTERKEGVDYENPNRNSGCRCTGDIGDIGLFARECAGSDAIGSRVAIGKHRSRAASARTANPRVTAGKRVAGTGTRAGTANPRVRDGTGCSTTHAAGTANARIGNWLAISTMVVVGFNPLTTALGRHKP